MRAKIRAAHLCDEATLVRDLVAQLTQSGMDQKGIAATTAELVAEVRTKGNPDFLNAFLAEYGLASTEGVALLNLAEALLRVPDSETTDELIADKILAGDWRSHLGTSKSRLINIASRAMLMAQSLLTQNPGSPRGWLQQPAIQSLGKPLIRFAVRRAMQHMGDRFVFATTINEAFIQARKAEHRGYTHSYDMLGEGARTSTDAMHYFGEYMNLAHRLSSQVRGDDLRMNPGISIKLSALHPRYEYAKHATVVGELGDRVRELCRLAARSNVGLNVDAEEAERLELSLDVFDYVLADPQLQDWPGFGIVVQAYGRRAQPVIQWISETARQRKCRLMVRLVKGAYWDSEIKLAQVRGVASFPVLTRKASTDVSYLACAQQLLRDTEWLYPQFGTHNAHTVAAILQLTGPDADFEFQRIHGMGVELHEVVRKRYGTRCRIYEPVGNYHDLLAYLARRLLENGANSSFVHQLYDTRIPVDAIARNPVDVVVGYGDSIAHPHIATPADIFGTERKNSRGSDLTDPHMVQQLSEQRDRFHDRQWLALPTLQDDPNTKPRRTRTVINPAQPNDVVGQVTDTSPTDIETAYVTALAGFPEWNDRPPAARAKILLNIADQYEAHTAELMALLAREAGKTWADAIGEIREAVDFCRYYAGEICRYATLGRGHGRGVFICISPWNFPLAIFTGQISAALSAGNAVIAKPAEQSSLIAARAVELMHAAGIPRNVLQLLPGDGEEIGTALVAHARVAGVCFTGSTATAQKINGAMADQAPPFAPLIAETGGINAAIVDSTALLEQAIDELIISAFQSAGQRCSAARVVYLQQDIAEHFLAMLYGAMAELKVGDPWHLATDIGPLIDPESQQAIQRYCQHRSNAGNEVRSWSAPELGHFVGPTVVRVAGIEDVEKEVFGPILHFATFKAKQLDAVVDRINAHGYGLTLSVYSRIQSRIDRVLARAKVGNIYINRNQIGAVVGSQPFGGEALSGTGPKAGGPHYLDQFLAESSPPTNPTTPGSPTSPPPQSAEQFNSAVQKLYRQPPSSITPTEICTQLESLLKRLDGNDEYIDEKQLLTQLTRFSLDPITLPGPTGESNTLSLHPRGVFACLGMLASDPESARRLALRQAITVLTMGNSAVIVTPEPEPLSNLLAEFMLSATAIAGLPHPDELAACKPLAGVCVDGTAEAVRPYRQALARRPGPIIPLLHGHATPTRLLLERSVCIDTTAAGGNASLVVEAAD